jgi:hypothetical protein
MKTKITNDVQLLDAIRAKGWIVQGAGFKQETTFTSKTVNHRLLATIIPWESSLFCPSLDDKSMYWLATKKEAEWQLIGE